MIRTFPVVEVRVRLLELAPDAVLRPVLFLVDVTGRFASPPEFLCRHDMMRVGRANEMRIAHVERLLDRAKMFRHPVAVFLRRDTIFSSLLKDLLPVLVGTDVEDHLTAARPRRPGDHIRLYRFQGITEMRPPVHIRQGRGYIKFLIFGSFKHIFLTNRYLWSII